MNHSQLWLLDLDAMDAENEAIQMHEFRHLLKTSDFAFHVTDISDEQFSEICSVGSSNTRPNSHGGNNQPKKHIN